MLHTMEVLAGRDVELAKAVAASAWVADDITEVEQRALSGLTNVPAATAARMLEMIRPPEELVDDPGQWAVRLLAALVRMGQAMFEELADEPWVTDGVDDKDEALLVSAAGHTPCLAGIVRGHRLEPPHPVGDGLTAPGRRSRRLGIPAHGLRRRRTPAGNGGGRCARHRTICRRAVSHGSGHHAGPDSGPRHGSRPLRGVVLGPFHHSNEIRAVACQQTT